ncbi:lytic transglycosylase domain-containing protein [Sphingomonas ginkgonis]|nr:lytic transglycosylase domain-containing protein [Sphingomonas ginkgonis]
MSSMRRAALLLALLLGTATAASTQYAQPGYVQPTASASTAAADVAVSLNDWRRLRQSNGYAFQDYARFLITNPGWPGEIALRRAAEKNMVPGETPATVLAFFAATPPVSANGFARYADSLAASGRSVEALAAAREAWAGSKLSAWDEQNIFARYGAQFSAADHDRRVDRLLLENDSVNAARWLPYTSAVRRAAFTARLALLKRDPAAESLYTPVMAQVTTDAGLMMDRARYLQAAGYDAAARQLLARPHQFAALPVDTEKWYELLLANAKAALAARNYQQAFDIARQLDDAVPAGTDISLKSLGVRDDYTSLAWLAGETGLSLGRAAESVGIFDKYGKGGRSLQVSAKGAYWAGRAATQASQFAAATEHFSRAAAYPDLFYGQLALERLGRPVPVPTVQAALAVTPDQRTAFNQRRLVRAVRLLGGQGRRDEQGLFVRALSESLKTEADRVLATELAAQIGRQDLAVWTARSARNGGDSFYYRSAYPTLTFSDGRLWSITHGITRQESSFDRGAMSGVGARGMMQLMTGTAREQAGKLGIGYDDGRLTSDPSYNVMLGSAYFSRLLSNFGGSYPLAVAAYNAGTGNVRRWIAANGDPRRPGADVVRWIEDIPFSETRGYVQRVLENSVVYDQLNPYNRPAAPLHLSYYLGKSRPG